MPYIKDPDFAKMCVLMKTIEESYNLDDAIKNMINKVQNILKEYSHE